MFCIWYSWHARMLQNVLQVRVTQQTETKDHFTSLGHLGINTHMSDNIKCNWSLVLLEKVGLDTKLIHLQTPVLFNLCILSFLRVPSREQFSCSSLSIFMTTGSLSYHPLSQDGVKSSPFCGPLLKSYDFMKKVAPHLQFGKHSRLSASTWGVLRSYLTNWIPWGTLM